LVGFRRTVRAEIVQACAGLRAPPGGDRGCLWIAGLAGLRGMARHSREYEGLCRPEGASQRSGGHACVDCWLGRPWGHGLAQLSAGLRGAGQLSRDHVCLWIPSLAGLRGAGLCRPEVCGPLEIMNVCGSPAWEALRVRSGGYRVGLKGGSLVYHSPDGAEEQGWRIRDPMACRAEAPWAYGAGLGVQCWLFF
jgi:hypothetical protein